MSFIRLVGLMLLLYLSAGCGDQKGDPESAPVMQGNLQASCLTSFAQETGAASCQDYTGLTEESLAAYESTCRKSAAGEGVSRSFLRNVPCPDDGKLGGCSMEASRGVRVVTWSYTTGMDAIDQSKVDTARDSCENADLKNAEGNWISP